MIRVNILVEGQTEETFIRGLLATYLGEHNIFVRARSVETSRKRGVVTRGGGLKYERFKKDLNRWMKEDATAWYSSMIDFYALPDDFPGMDRISSINNPYSKIEHVENALANDVCSRFFLPYIQLHEFEALLLSKPEMFDNFFIGKREAVSQLVSYCKRFPSPEHINLGAETSPSKSIIRFIPEYYKAKTAASPIIASYIGMEKIRSRCRHFSEWIDRLIALGGQRKG